MMLNPQQLAEQKLTKIASEIPDIHRITPEELEQRTGIPQATWLAYLNQESIRQMIHKRTVEDVEFAQRKALAALSKEASRGNVQAIKEINQLSGILNQNNNKQFITHYIPRPTTNTPTPPKVGEVTQPDANANMPEM
jgi:phosphoribosyl-AMP cyclohydrolase